jgi:hypothetical protein
LTNSIRTPFLVSFCTRDHRSSRFRASRSMLCTIRVSPPEETQQLLQLRALRVLARGLVRKDPVQLNPLDRDNRRDPLRCRKQISYSSERPQAGPPPQHFPGSPTRKVPIGHRGPRFAYIPPAKLSRLGAGDGSRADFYPILPWVPGRAALPERAFVGPKMRSEYVARAADAAAVIRFGAGGGAGAAGRPGWLIGFGLRSRLG